MIAKIVLHEDAAGHMQLMDFVARMPVGTHMKPAADDESIA